MNGTTLNDKRQDRVDPIIETPNLSVVGPKSRLPKLGRAKAALVVILYSVVVVCGGAVVFIITLLLAAPFLNLIYSSSQVENDLMPPSELVFQWVGLGRDTVLRLFYVIHLLEGAIRLAVVLGITSFVCRRVHNSSLSSLGLFWPAKSGRSIAFCFCVGLVIAPLNLLPVALQSMSSKDQTDLTAYLGTLGFMSLLSLMVVLVEEIAFRGYVLQILERSWGGSVALILSSIVFVFVHFAAEPFNVNRMVGLFALGIMFGYVFIHTRNLWCSIAIHLGWNQGGAIVDISIKRLFVDGQELLSEYFGSWEATTFQVILVSACAVIVWAWVKRTRRADAVHG